MAAELGTARPKSRKADNFSLCKLYERKSRNSLSTNEKFASIASGKHPFGHSKIRHSQSQWVVPSNFFLFKRCELFVSNCTVFQ